MAAVTTPDWPAAWVRSRLGHEPRADYLEQGIPY